jgi:hypothetical protein
MEISPSKIPFFMCLEEIKFQKGCIRNLFQKNSYCIVEIALTICLAIKCRDVAGKKEKPSLLFASDTQESSLYLKRSVTKMRLMMGNKPKKYKNRWDVVIASAEDALVIDEVVNNICNRDRPSVEIKRRKGECWCWCL